MCQIYSTGTSLVPCSVTSSLFVYMWQFVQFVFSNCFFTKMQSVSVNERQEYIYCVANAVRRHVYCIIYIAVFGSHCYDAFSTKGNTHTHPFNGPFSGTTQVSQYQKGKSNLDFTEARDSEWQWHQLGHMRVCISIQTDNHASTTQRKVFCRPDALPAAQPTASKHWRQKALKAKQQKGTTPKILPLLSGVSGHLIHGSFGPPENPSSNSIS